MTKDDEFKEIVIDALGEMRVRRAFAHRCGGFDLIDAVDMCGMGSKEFHKLTEGMKLDVYSECYYPAWACIYLN